MKITAKKNIKLRGQAFIEFETQEGATNAVIALSGYMFYGKPLKTNYAKSPSDFENLEKGQNLDQVKKEREDRRAKERDFVQKKRIRKEIEKVMEMRRAKEEFDSKNQMFKQMDEDKNNILFIEGLSTSTKTEDLNRLFGQFKGFHEVRHFKHKCYAFVEYEGVHDAGRALAETKDAQLDGPEGSQIKLKVSFSRR